MHTGDGNLEAIRAETKRFLEAVDDASDPDAVAQLDDLLDEYLSFRNLLAEEFSAIATRLLLTGTPVLNDTRHTIKERMREEYLRLGLGPAPVVRSYTRTTQALLEYLRHHAGERVAASRLRLLTGDQVHTERRVRELRELGFSISWEREGQDTFYVLDNASPDIDKAAEFHIVKQSRPRK